MQQQQKLRQFDFQNKWLKGKYFKKIKNKKRIYQKQNQQLIFFQIYKYIGEDYAYILQNKDKYCQQFQLQTFPQKTHPENIYTSPENGQIYYVEGTCIGSSFGFPRVSFKKKYRWKKMNFTTDLPKGKPLVTYIVASAEQCQRNNLQKDNFVYRMHAVILNNQCLNNPETIQNNTFILCHVRKLPKKNKQNQILSKCDQKKKKRNQITNDLFKNQNLIETEELQQQKIEEYQKKFQSTQKNHCFLLKQIIQNNCRKSQQLTFKNQFSQALIENELQNNADINYMNLFIKILQN
ncbi:hypothetical protein IMG5_195860 [Ichthyophthirius multifiliis]|uniref:Uncharacterized protein n=1 Tax=Ichthyophthirius multifiliis TaxID=5932 RepID=G0R502_ICHMU|nr:hypothetical protein IMG5_195860 [Ichthyophthirius multifiliis]EGR27404.1 hypothetical protein IMG5_195860 [Ichthyophthirius multifiliis]|eukprot:XP_004024300.1 hypothetical protein IMG5_195860 [Ichthyophthirius multifiliis]